jgi:hypothetical protein
MMAETFSDEEGRLDSKFNLSWKYMCIKELSKP